MDVRRELAQVERAVSVEALGARAVRLARPCPASVEDVWSSLTDAEQIARWLAPVAGDLRLGGRYQLEGNAGGEILACEAPQRLSVTWEFDGETTRVDVRLRETEDGTRVELTHTGSHDPAKWEAYGPGAVGIGWEMALLALSALFRDLDVDALLAGPEGVTLVSGSGDAWGEAAAAAGDEPDHAREAARRCVAAYTAPPPQD